MSLLVKGQAQGREIVSVTPQSANWRFVGFAAYRLAAAERIRFDTAEREVCIVVLRGVVSVQAGDHAWKEIGERQSVFDHSCHMPCMCRIAMRSPSAPMATSKLRFAAPPAMAAWQRA